MDCRGTIRSSALAQEEGKGTKEGGPSPWRLSPLAGNSVAEQSGAIRGRAIPRFLGSGQVAESELGAAQSGIWMQVAQNLIFSPRRKSAIRSANRSPRITKKSSAGEGAMQRFQ
jgi:hypothetical protein